MNFEQTLKEFNDLVKHGQELIEKLKQAKEPVKERHLGKLLAETNKSIEYLESD